MYKNVQMGVTKITQYTLMIKKIETNLHYQLKVFLNVNVHKTMGHCEKANLSMKNMVEIVNKRSSITFVEFLIRNGIKFV